MPTPRILGVGSKLAARAVDARGGDGVVDHQPAGPHAERAARAVWCTGRWGPHTIHLFTAYRVKPFIATLPLCLTLLAAPVLQTRTSAPAQSLTRVLLDTDANNELDDQHAIAYMLFSGDVFDVEAITVNRTRGGGDVEKQAEEAERVVTLAGLRRVFPVFRGANGSFAEIAPHVGESSFDGASAVNEIIKQAKAPGSPLT